jgi:hypothetical protein
MSAVAGHRDGRCLSVRALPDRMRAGRRGCPRVGIPVPGIIPQGVCCESDENVPGRPGGQPRRRRPRGVAPPFHGSAGLPPRGRARPGGLAAGCAADTAQAAAGALPRVHPLGVVGGRMPARTTGLAQHVPLVGAVGPDGPVAAAAGAGKRGGAASGGMRCAHGHGGLLGGHGPPGGRAGIRSESPAGVALAGLFVPRPAGRTARRGVRGYLTSMIVVDQAGKMPPDQPRS